MQHDSKAAVVWKSRPSQFRYKGEYGEKKERVLAEVKGSLNNHGKTRKLDFCEIFFKVKLQFHRHTFLNEKYKRHEISRNYNVYE